jgi:2-polyprenyl-6-methoxyphenol hydroxylase-like FAD-dependent oxidoreductase
MYWLWGHGKTIGLLPVSDDQIYVAGVGKAVNTDRPDQETVPGTFREKFACFGGLVPDILNLDINTSNILYTVMEEVKLPPPWAKGRVLVIGDAAHAACPFWAQGAAVGIEDAIALAEELAGADNADAGLAAWFERRYARAKFVQEGSFGTGQNLTRDEESDEPKFFPPPVREMMAKQGAEIQARLAEPF